MTTWNNDTVRELERESLRSFMASCSPFYVGNVLDVGAGKQPYRNLVEAAGASYHPFDDPDLPASVADEASTPDFTLEWDCVICNQVLQYIPNPPGFVAWLAELVEPDGHVVLTYATNWPEVEKEDHHRFTYHGMERLFAGAGLTVVKHERRAEINLNGYVLPIGGGIVGQAP